MKVFLDTNVLLDVLAKREPHCVAGAEVWSLAERGAISGYISAVSFNNVHYVLRRVAGRPLAREALKILRDVFQLIPADEQIIHRAIDSDFSDFEDAIQFFSAHRAGADFLITRNVRHFPKDPIAVVTPEEFLKTEPK
jgi:predicted nucleic acid-binding protein